MTDEPISAPTGRALHHRLALAQRDARIPAITAAVARRGEPVWSGAAGTLDGRADGAQPAADTQFRVGSITKTMVAVLVLRLVDAGRIRLEDPIGDHVPGAPAGDATVYQLLTHTAGLASETPPPWWERTPGTLRPAVADILPAEPRRQEPGRLHHYSNPGFGLLGELVAVHAGRPWFDVLRDDVLDPLGMARTSYLPAAPHATGWAVHPWADVLLPEPSHDHGLLAAAGQLWSTPSDLCRFGVFLAGHGHDEILSPDTRARMRAPAVAPGDASWSSSYGLGVQQLRLGDRVVSGHTGSMPGFLAILATSAEDDVTIAVQANAWSELKLSAVYADLLDIVREQEPTFPTPWSAAGSVEPAAWELVGPWYWGAVPLAITLRADGRLALAGIGARGRTTTLEPQPDARWRGTSGYYDGEYLEVHRDSTGAVTHLDLGSFVFTRAPYAPGDVVPDGLTAGDWQR